MVVGDAHTFPGFLTLVLTQLFFPKPPTTFLTNFSRGESRKYAGKKFGLNRVSNYKPSGHESDKLTMSQPAGAAKKTHGPKRLDKALFNIFNNFTTTPILNRTYTCDVYKRFHDGIRITLSQTTNFRLFQTQRLFFSKFDENGAKFY